MPASFEQRPLEQQQETTRRGRRKWLPVVALAHGIKGQRGFSLIETMAAIAIISITVIGSMVVMGTVVRTADRAEGNVKFLQLVRSQVEAIKHAEFQEDPANYTLLAGLPEGTSISIEVTDAGITYTRPAPDSSVIDGVMQKIVVTGKDQNVETTMTFFKLDTR